MPIDLSSLPGVAQSWWGNSGNLSDLASSAMSGPPQMQFDEQGNIIPQDFSARRAARRTANINEHPAIQEMRGMTPEQVGAHHSESVNKQMGLWDNYKRLLEMQHDPTNKNYDEAQVRQGSLEDALREHEGALREGGDWLTQQQAHIAREYGGQSPFHRQMDALTMDPSEMAEMNGYQSQTPNPLMEQFNSEPSSDEYYRQQENMWPMTEPANQNLPSGNPMTPLSRPQIPSLGQGQTQTPEMGYTPLKPASENEPQNTE